MQPFQSHGINMLRRGTYSAGPALALLLLMGAALLFMEAAALLCRLHSCCLRRQHACARRSPGQGVQCAHTNVHLCARNRRY